MLGAENLRLEQQLSVHFLFHSLLVFFGKPGHKATAKTLFIPTQAGKYDVTCPSRCAVSTGPLGTKVWGGCPVSDMGYLKAQGRGFEL